MPTIVMPRLQAFLICTALLYLPTLLHAQEKSFKNIGIGGGGAMYIPVVSPHDPNLLFVACDMGGVYRSNNGGASWTMLDKRDLRGATSCPPLFHPENPNLIYAYGAGRLRVSRDKGKTFQVLAEKPPWGDGAVIALGIDPRQPEIMLAGTESMAYRSEDGGKSWTKTDGMSGRVLGFEADTRSEATRRVLFAGTSEGVFRSDDGGQNWRSVSEGLPWKELRAFCGGADPRTKRLVLYCTIPSKTQNGQFAGGVYRSFDGGASWQSAMGEGINTTVGRQDVDGVDEIPQYSFLGMARTRPNIVYATTRGNGYWPPYHYTVYRSDDFGDHWRSCFTGDPRFKNHNVELGWLPLELVWGWGGAPSGFSVNGADPDMALYSNSGELYITRDGGVSWRNIYSNRIARRGNAKAGEKWASRGLEVTSSWHFDFDPHDSKRAYICYTDIGFARSEDKGRTWKLSVKGSPWRNTWYQIAFDPIIPGVIYAACSDQHDIPHWASIEKIRYGGGVCFSENHGATWRKLGEGLPNAPATSIVLDPRSPPHARVLYAAMFGQGVFKSQDSGAHWMRLENGPGTIQNRHVYSLKLHADGSLFCSVTGKRAGRDFADGGGLYRSRDGGLNWQLISPPLKWAGDFDFDPRDSRVLYLAAASPPGFPQGGLYKTTDGGTTWKQLLKESDFPSELSTFVHAFFVHVHPTKPNVIYFSATTHGLFLSEDTGAHWREVRGIPFTATQRVTLDPDDENSIWITTFGGGVWKGPAKGVLPVPAQL